MMTNKKMNPFHLVEMSPWPIMASIGSMSFMLSMILIMNKNSKMVMASMALMIVTAYAWWRDVYRESSMMGEHLPKVKSGLKMGMILFITSEILFFVSFFWSFFHSSVSPAMEMGQTWPPNDIEVFDPMSIPLMNTILLLSSGVTITWSHHEMMKMNMAMTKKSLMMTIALGAVFTTMQWMEYVNSPFSLSDSIFGTTFFMMTGFHGIHVVIGTLFLAVSLKQMSNMKSSSKNYLTFELSAWYWHFVDVVWLFLYTTIYWWGM